jgi:hypothetical protein
MWLTETSFKKGYSKMKVGDTVKIIQNDYVDVSTGTIIRFDYDGKVAEICLPCGERLTIGVKYLKPFDRKFRWRK